MGLGGQVPYCPVPACVQGEGHPQNSLRMKRCQEAARVVREIQEGSTVFRGMSLIGEKARLSGSLRGAESHESEGTGTPIQDRPWGLKVSLHY